MKQLNAFRAENKELKRRQDMLEALTEKHRRLIHDEALHNAGEST
jgi:type IV secretory pathway VirD2 relaxase